LNTYVLDASVAAKWMLPAGGEDLHEEAAEWLERLLGNQISLVVPDLFWIETSNLIWRAVRFGRISGGDGVRALADLRDRDLETVTSIPLLGAALEIAFSYNRSVYDSIYVALAKDRSTSLITADEKLANAVAAYLPVKWLGAFEW
jgi:predicted nucleic acid-binding protein